MRGATVHNHVAYINGKISIHAPRERSDDKKIIGESMSAISIHAPRERSDRKIKARHVYTVYFNPRSSWEERQTAKLMERIIKNISIHAPRERSDAVFSCPTSHINISIHAPRERSDSKSWTHSIKIFYFNPRSSWEERLLTLQTYNKKLIFQSTLLVRGATRGKFLRAKRYIISIHAPRERSDISDRIKNMAVAFISIHAPRERSD